MLMCPGCHTTLALPHLHTTTMMYPPVSCHHHQPLRLPALVPLPATQPLPAPHPVHPGQQLGHCVVQGAGHVITSTGIVGCATTAHLVPAVQTPYVCGRMFQVPNGVGLSSCLGVPHSACHTLCCLTCTHACPAPLPCPTQDKGTTEARASLHTSGGGIMETDKDRSVSPDAKINYPASLAAFKLPEPAVAAAPPREEAWTAAGDSRVLARTNRDLEESGWYYGSLSWQQAASLLKDTAVGTFLVRDSASPTCLYSLSVQTTNGPTSVRIHYARGKFRLDCTGHSARLMPEFPGVVELAEHYVAATTTQVWVDHEGNTFSPINISKPLRRSPPSLQQLCRLALNAGGREAAKGVLPPALRAFLDTYPHTC